ncbi:protein phosphatase 2C domain-containing protein [Streptomyces triculaminicus]|uniref:protein phosphatase 2C domain-containing protein n=1 Tax=Streptomyces triculaminicus TaxID=2816232 RepID=UPI0037D0586A
MSQQGDHYAEQEDAWWRELYGRSEPDTAGAAATGDSLDERFSSASAVVGPESSRPRAEPRRPRITEPPGGPVLGPSVSPAGLSPALSRGVPRQAKRWPATPNGTLPVPAHQPPGFDDPPELRPPAGPVPRPEGPPPPDPRTRVSPPPVPPLPVPRDAREPADAPGPAPAAGGDGGPDDAGIMDIAEVTGVAETTGGSGVTTAEATAAKVTDRAGTPGVPDVKSPRSVVGTAGMALGSGLPGLADPSEAARASGTAEVSEPPPPADRRPARREGARLRAADFVGRRPPTYEPEPTAWPPADPGGLEDLVPDTVLDGARYGAMTLRATSLRGDSARFRGEPRRDALLTARFGTGEDALLLVAMASGARAAEGAHRAAREICEWIGGAVGRSHARLAEDIHAGRRDELKSGLHRLTDRTYGRLRVRATALGLSPSEYTAGLRCLLLPADVRCRTRVFFGVGGGGLFRLRDGAWQDLDPEPRAPESAGELAPGRADAVGGYDPTDRITVDLGIPTPGTTPVIDPDEVPSEPFRFRASIARPGDALLLCTAGLADPLRGEPELSVRLAERWAREEPPGLAEFLADAQLRVKGYADDRSACAVWEV